MMEKALDPFVPYPGSTELPWQARCVTCETVIDPGPARNNIRGTQGGCPGG